MTPKAALGIAEAKQICLNANSSFMLPIRLLPKQKRQGMMVLYAFARVIDDAADMAESKQQALDALSPFQKDLNAIMSDEVPQMQLMAAVSLMTKRFDWDTAMLQSLLDGVRFDVNTPPIRPSFHALKQYCRQVACSVGYLTLQVLAPKYPHKTRLSLSMGLALQFTNILRDVDEDLQRQRLYLPDEAMTAASISPQVPLGILSVNPKIDLAKEWLHERTQKQFSTSKKYMKKGSVISLWPVWLMRWKYTRVFNKINNM